MTCHANATSYLHHAGCIFDRIFRDALQSLAKRIPLKFRHTIRSRESSQNPPLPPPIVEKLETASIRITYFAIL